jgi:hypothetical protein
MSMTLNVDTSTGCRRAHGYGANTKAGYDTIFHLITCHVNHLISSVPHVIKQFLSVYSFVDISHNYLHQNDELSLQYSKIIIINIFLIPIEY